MNIHFSNQHKRKLRIRHKLKAVAGHRPRLTVFRSNKHLYAQIIDDSQGKTLVAVSDRIVTKSKKTSPSKTEKAHAVGIKLAQIALSANIKHIYFDRGHYKFHGRIKALAQAARENGLEF